MVIIFSRGYEKSLYQPLLFHICSIQSTKERSELLGDGQVVSIVVHIVLAILEFLNIC